MSSSAADEMPQARPRLSQVERPRPRQEEGEDDEEDDRPCLLLRRRGGAGAVGALAAALVAAAPVTAAAFAAAAAALSLPRPELLPSAEGLLLGHAASSAYSSHVTAESTPQVCGARPREAREAAAQASSARRAASAAAFLGGEEKVDEGICVDG